MNDVILKCMYLGVIRSRPTADDNVTIQHNNLNRKNIIQNQKYKCKNNNKLIHLTFIHSTRKFEKHKQSFLGENNEQTFPNKNHKQSHKVEGEESSFLLILGDCPVGASSPGGPLFFLFLKNETRFYCFILDFWTLQKWAIKVS